MSTVDLASAPPRRAADLRTNIDEQLRTFFETSSHVAPIGNMVSGLVAVSLLWPHVPRVQLWIWFGVVVVLAGLQARAAFHPDDAPLDQGASGRLIDTNILAGVVWGVLPWLDIGTFGSDEVYRWICLALAFAIGAGAMGGLSVLTGFAIRVHVPLYSLVALAFLSGGSPEVAVGVVVYLALMVGDLRGTGRNLRRLVALRVETAELAADAETEARHDPLTGVLNRTGALERIAARRGGPPFALMFVDLDHFKEVNDRLGHEAGDRVLVETARRIDDIMRSEDIVARLGGDEFLVVFDKGDADLDRISSRVLSEVERPIRLGEDEVSISASIGVTVVDQVADWNTSMLLREADHALYEAKRAGRQRIVWFDDRLAVATGAIDAMAQPVVDMATGGISSVEVTPRWTSSEGTEIPPSVFLPLAEEIGLIDTVTRSMLDRAATARVRWRKHPVLDSAAVTVRVVGSHLMRGGLVDDVGAVFVAHDLRPGELQLMVTETAEIRDPRFAAEAITSMRGMGVGIVLGEFGSGKSTLGDLIRLPIDVVAVHPSLVRTASENKRAETLLRALHQVAGSLDLAVAADGVDRSDELDIVRRLRLPYAQGEALHPRQSFAELESMTRARSDRTAHSVS